mmetsp:Transcript_52648/g.146668  ORF Transcript_52648/g.146668 Transcript_52648/m.146668 type:complete len:348 (-) Transcript_52648:4945-5988(-)
MTSRPHWSRQPSHERLVDAMADLQPTFAMRTLIYLHDNVGATGFGAAATLAGSRMTLPLSLLAVAKPTFPSFSARTRTLRSPVAFSSAGVANAWRISPGSSLRTTPAVAISKVSCNTVPSTHLYCGDHGDMAFGANVNHPTAPSLKFRPLTRLAPSFTSVFGPSVTSKTSPTSSVRTTELPGITRDSSGPARLQTNNLSLASAYAVPWLPLIVTQPSCASLVARTLIRVRFFFSSTCSSSNGSRDSPTSSFRMALPSEMSSDVVTAMLCLHTSNFVNSSVSKPVASRSVNQPVLPSFWAFPRTRCMSCDSSFRGPSMTSNTSPTFIFRTSALPPSKASLRTASWSQQ